MGDEWGCRCGIRCGIAYLIALYATCASCAWLPERPLAPPAPLFGYPPSKLWARPAVPASASVPASAPVALLPATHRPVWPPREVWTRWHLARRSDCQLHRAAACDVVAPKLIGRSLSIGAFQLASASLPLMSSTPSLTECPHPRTEWHRPYSPKTPNPILNWMLSSIVKSTLPDHSTSTEKYQFGATTSVIDNIFLTPGVSGKIPG